MERVGQPVGASNLYTYRARVIAAHPASNYTPRVIPKFAGAAVPLEAARIVWQR
jgi:starch phosphorylase